jgi:hypothetical protein
MPRGWRRSCGIVDVFMDGSVTTSPDSIRVVAEPEMLKLARTARSTWRNWIKKGSLEEPKDGLYRESDVLEVLVFAMVVSAMGLSTATVVWRRSGKLTVAECQRLPLDRDVKLTLVVDTHGLDVRLTRTARELESAVAQQLPVPRAHVCVRVGAVVQEARQVFWTLAAKPSDLASDGRRRSKRSSQSALS